MNQQQTSSRRSNLIHRFASRRGLSLLEVILALAILGGALAVLGSIVRVGTRSARHARGRVSAGLHCKSIMAEITAGIIPVEPMQPGALSVPDPEYDWMYSIDVEPTEMEGMLAVRVDVIENKPLTASPISTFLVRWVLDPSFLAEAAAADAEASSQTGDTAPDGSTSSSSPTSGSSSGSSSGDDSSGRSP